MLLCVVGNGNQSERVPSDSPKRAELVATRVGAGGRPTSTERIGRGEKQTRPARSDRQMDIRRGGFALVINLRMCDKHRSQGPARAAAA
jgi:hypothetical protein